MVHDDLLEQIRQPLLDRVDRRLAVILAVSIGAHLAIAILGWINDPSTRAWLDDPPQPAYTVETIDSLDLPEPTPATAQPGTAAMVAPKPVPSAAVVPAAVPGSHHRGTPKAIDPRALVADLVGGDPSFKAAGRRVGRDLDDQLATAGERDQQARVGKAGGEESFGIGDDGGPDVTGVDTVTRTDKPKEKEPPPPKTIIDEPTFPFDTDWLTQGARFRAIQRCYGHSPEFLAHEPAKVKLAMTLGPTGKVLAASADGPKGLAACVEDRARTWSFPVANRAAVEVRAAFIFVAE